jgi:hypothetical protein
MKKIKERTRKFNSEFGSFEWEVPENTGWLIDDVVRGLRLYRLDPLDKRVSDLERERDILKKEASSLADSFKAMSGAIRLVSDRVDFSGSAHRAQAALIEITMKKIDALVEHLGLTMDFYPSTNTLSPAHYVAKKKVQGKKANKETKKGKSGGPAK